MKKLLLTSAAFVAFGATSFAADLPAPMAMVEPLPVAAPYSWTGFYLGAQVGYAFRNGGDGDGCVDGTAELYDDGPNDIIADGTTDVDCDDFDAFSEAELIALTSGAAPFGGDGFLESDSDDGDGGIFAGLHIGADWQMGNFVIGALVDYNWSDIDGSSGEGTYDEDLYEYPGALPLGSVGTVDDFLVIEDNGGAPADANEEDTVDPRTDFAFQTGGVDSWGTARVRAGLAAGRALFYATGGLAFGDIGDSSYDVTEYYTNRERRNSLDDLAAFPDNCEDAVSVGAGGGPTGGASANTATARTVGSSLVGPWARASRCSLPTTSASASSTSS